MDIMTCSRCRLRVMPSPQGTCPSCGTKLAEDRDQPASNNLAPADDAAKGQKPLVATRAQARDVPATNIDDKFSATRNAASVNLQRRAALQQMKFAGCLLGSVVVLVVGMGVWEAFFSKEKVLARRYRTLIAQTFEAADRLSKQLPENGEFKERKALSESGVTASLANTMVLSLQSVNDPQHAIDFRLPADRVAIGVRGAKHNVLAMYDWRPADAIAVDRDGMYSFDVEQGTSHLQNIQYMILVRFVRWQEATDDGHKRLQPGYAEFDTFLFELDKESLIAAKRHRIDQSGVSIYAVPGRFEEEARRLLVKSVDDQIQAWLEDGYVATKAELWVEELLQASPPLVQACRELGAPAQRATLSGGALILDLDAQGISKANDQLPLAMRAGPESSELTLFVIAEEHKTATSLYNSENKDDPMATVGFRADIDLAIIRWPSKQPIGIVRLEGDPPPAHVSIRQFQNGAATKLSGITGWSDFTVSAFVQGLAATGAPDAIADALAVSGDKQEPPEQLTIVNKGMDEFEYAQDAAAPMRMKKAIVWDVVHQRFMCSEANRLPDNMRGSLADEQLSVFVITDVATEPDPPQDDKRWITGSAQVRGRLVSWPESKLVCEFELRCEKIVTYSESGKFQHDERGQVAIHPDWGLRDIAVLSLRRWIESLPERDDEATR